MGLIASECDPRTLMDYAPESSSESASSLKSNIEVFFLAKIVILDSFWFISLLICLLNWSILLKLD